MKSTQYLSSLIYPVVFILMIILQGCSIGGKFLPEATSIATLNKDEVVIVGRISLTPKLEKDEQVLDAKGVIDVMGYGDKNKNRSMIQFNASPSESGYKYVINPEMDKVFFFKVPRNMKYIVDGSVLMEFSRYGATGKIILPTGFKVDIKPTDKAVYIGDIKYQRDDFNSITRIELKDNFRAANKLFRKKFGKKYNLRKSLVVKLK